ncbi:hypothetical protein AB669_03655 [Pedobacter sp. BMA]|nr:hypothetical protein AB669_03655 [Pedobacter sp. BMA]
MAVLCLNFSLSAQEVVPLKIGDKVPERFWTEKLQVRNGSVTSEQTLAVYKGKAIILDFWSTHCSPCIKAFPKLAQLQVRFANDLRIIGIEQVEKEKIDAFFMKQAPLGFPTVVGDKYLNKLFKHVYIPHEVWIDAKGIVTGFTNGDEVNDSSIASFIAGDKIKAEMKIDQDLSKPLYASEALPVNRLLYYSIWLKGHLEGVGASNREIDLPGTYGITWSNQPLVFIMQSIARRQIKDYSGKRVMISSADSLDLFYGKLKGEARKSWFHSHEYTMSITMSKRDTMLLSKKMLQLLNDQCGYSVRVEKRLMPCLVMTKLKGESPTLKADGAMVNTLAQVNEKKLRNARLFYLTAYLNEENNGLPIIVDETGWKGKIDFDLTSSRVQDLQKQLREIGFSLEPAERELEVMTVARQEGE